MARNTTLTRADRLAKRRLRRQRGGQMAVMVAITFGILILSAVAAFAYITFTDSSNAHAAKALADLLPTGNTPTSAATTLNPNSNTVSVAFAQASTTTGHVAIPAANYTLKRYPIPTGPAV